MIKNYRRKATANQAFRKYVVGRADTSLPPGETNLGLYRPQDTIPTGQPRYLLHFDSPLGSIQTLYLTGTLLEPESIIINETFPEVQKTDSVTGVRFINLTASESIVRFDVQQNGTPITMEKVGRLKFSDYLLYPAYNGMSDYFVTAVDPITEEPLASLRLSGIGNTGVSNRNVWRNNFSTVALIGEKNNQKHPIQLVLIQNTLR